MCTVCGCGEARVADAEHHDHEPARVVIHHHHHYHHQGDVHHHYHGAPVEHGHSHTHGHHHHEHEHEHEHEHGHEHGHDHEHGHPQGLELHYGRGAAGVSMPGMSQRSLIAVERDVLDKNNRLAEHNREHFAAAGQLVLNLVSSPGSGKTTLLCETLRRLAGHRPCAVIEGDQQTSSDAERIRATGVAAVQINTGKGCHLDAQMIHDACHRLELAQGGIIFIENVGNLVCPAGFDLGERAKVAVLSVTEGEEKPLKYPDMFAAASLMIINKTDLLPYVQFDVARCIENARRVNPAIQVLQLSASSGEGMDAWLAWLAKM
ncbi:hydrogenase nickel incorporation protein HypB [Aeromonas simiae]|uniref:hydrogenase nickel incorporation protein HypB n=1 Tax=Aeromonas simiae TaxID=218936 RepID=UPI0005A79C56|nr:hydrogenase nickel incorporation protein HypB [Aeromonas simiae]MDO2948328.1 hydrogenase nickel incorporation protein HypB [Aeromonas simiae]MDO2955711.1 hydrogenase nickel incorporation protein HypB [Aeromonas simiae]